MASPCRLCDGHTRDDEASSADCGLRARDRVERRLRLRRPRLRARIARRRRRRRGARSARASRSRRSRATGDGCRAIRERNTAGAATLALLQRLGAARGYPAHRSQGTAAGQRGRQQRRQRRRGRGRRQRAPRPAGAARRPAASVRLPAKSPAAARRTPTTRRRRSTAGSCSRARRDPPDIVRLPVPPGLSCAVLHPQIEVETGAARRLLGVRDSARGRGPPVGESRRAGRRACSSATSRW